MHMYWIKEEQILIIRVPSTFLSDMMPNPKPTRCLIQILSNYVSREVEFDEDTWNWNINIKEIKEDKEARMEVKESSPSPSSHHSSPALSSSYRRKLKATKEKTKTTL